MEPDPRLQDQIQRFEEQLEANPDSLVFARLADLHRKAGDPGRGLEILRRGLDRHPEYASGHIVRGRCLRDEGREEEARRSFERVLELDGQNLVALRALAELARERGDREEARRRLESLLQLDPRNEPAQEMLDELTGEEPDGPGPEAGKTGEDRAVGEFDEVDLPEPGEETPPEGTSIDEPAEEAEGSDEDEPIGWDDDFFDEEPAGTDPEVGGKGEDRPLGEFDEVDLPEPGEEAPPEGAADEPVADEPASEEPAAYGEIDLPEPGETEGGPPGLEEEGPGGEPEPSGLEADEEPGGEADGPAAGEPTSGEPVPEEEDQAEEEAWDDILAAGEPEAGGTAGAPPADEVTEPAAPGDPEPFGEPGEQPEEPDTSVEDEPDGGPPAGQDLPGEASPAEASPAFGEADADELRDRLEELARDVEDEEEAAEDDLATETLAGLYEAQGFHRQAVEMYEELVDQRPEDEELRRRLERAREALEAVEDAEAGEEGAADSAPEAPSAEPGRTAREQLRALLRGEARPAGAEGER